MRLFSTEQISKYHPDKYADQISDAILTACLKQDRKSHVGCEVMVKDNTIVLGGEITTGAVVDFESVARSVAKKLGYKVDRVINIIGKQSQEINNAVSSQEKIGAGDQGIMFGYATKETESFLPFAFDLANRIIQAIELDVDGNKETILAGDAKTQVTVDLDALKTMESVETILISVCHHAMHRAGIVTIDMVQAYVTKLLMKSGIELSKRTKLLVNPAGTWTVGGPTADCGLTGRKIVCDQYGGFVPVGGGAFSGKDPSKVDRSASYMARKIAIDLIGDFDLDECEVQLAYAIGVPEPVSVNVKTNSNTDFSRYVTRRYDLTPLGIINHLGLYDVDYEKLAEGCHYRK